MGAKKGAVISAAEPAQALNETYDRLIATAVVKFATVGLDGTSTRDIARDANVALSAINYHFGSKTELYRAAVWHAADWMIKPIEPTLEKARALLAAGPDADSAVAALVDLTGIVADVLLAPGEEGEAASQLALRELVIPGVGQDIIAKSVVEPIIACATALLKHLNISDGDENRIALDATALFGPTTLFRILNNHSLGMMSAGQARRIQDAARQATRRYIMALVNGR